MNNNKIYFISSLPLVYGFIILVANMVVNSGVEANLFQFLVLSSLFIFKPLIFILKPLGLVVCYQDWFNMCTPNILGVILSSVIYSLVLFIVLQIVRKLNHKA